MSIYFIIECYCGTIILLFLHFVYEEELRIFMLIHQHNQTSSADVIPSELKEEVKKC
jgi:hypothetical protein